jgi:cytochrome c peroxidase
MKVDHSTAADSVAIGQGLQEVHDRSDVRRAERRRIARPSIEGRDSIHIGVIFGGQIINLVAHGEYCGMFRTPSLRNVAIRRVFFHNGLVHRLEDAVRFYMPCKNESS